MECIVNKVIVNYVIKGSGKPILMLNGYYSDMKIMIDQMEPIFRDNPGW